MRVRCCHVALETSANLDSVAPSPSYRAEYGAHNFIIDYWLAEITVSRERYRARFGSSFLNCVLHASLFAKQSGKKFT
ncbi:hypothetical protein DES52_110182 [Deinococcus yavapaiensis KR-236]|uniref:Uncharacterized protein n=1 Tax=Deinococcus yavapaiensis KR-236 TaxID=694435 RepID=A0A318S3W0_9DEIO|nr:hypothetical protein DES52_110182 [Deinococcus yavapaiensis KR-236]